MDSFSVICISLHDTDKIRVMNLPRDMVDSLRAIIQSSWQRGIQSEGSYAISHEFKLHGKPWLGEGEEANDSRRLIARILGFMLQRGWALTIATDISKKRYGLDTMYFKRQIPEPNVLTSAISFNKTDLIRVIDGTVELAEVVRSAIQNCWHRGLQDARTYYGVPEFKMHGSPWLTSGTDTMHTRMFVAHLLGALDGAGWQVYTSIDISHGKGGGEENSSVRSMDSWVLRRKA